MKITLNFTFLTLKTLQSYLARQSQQLLVLLLCTIAAWSSLQAQVSFGPVQYNPFGVSNIPVLTRPVAADMDGDGDLDFWAGDPFTSGGIRYYQNTGTAANANFAAPVLNPFNLSVPFGLLTVERLDVGDMDGDGDMDMIILDTDFSGNVVLLYFQNTGTATAPSFAAPVTNPFSFSGIQQSALLPALADIDSDNDLDLFIGFDSGDMIYWENTGTATTAVFGSPVTNPFNISSNALGLGLSATFVDLDMDGDLDFLANDDIGTFQYYQNTGTAVAPSFVGAVSNPFGLTSIDPALRNMPYFADMDGDGDADILAANTIDTLFYFENTTPAGVACNFSQNNILVNETSGSVTVTINLMGAPSVAASVDVVLSANGTATNGADFTFTSPTTVNFPAGSAAPQNISIPITNDALSEYFEDFTLRLANPTGGILVGPTDSLTIEIDDDDYVPPTLAFSPASLNVNEGAGSVTATVTLSAAPPTVVLADVRLGGGSATNGSDYNFSSPVTLAFSPTTTSQTITIPITDDALTEGTETIQLEFDPNNVFGPVTINNTPLVISILDNDAPDPTVSFVGNSATISEAGGGLTIDLSIADPNANPTNVDVILSGSSSATNGTDFTFTSPTTVTFPANSSANQSITIPIINDAVIEALETIQLQLVNPTNGAVIGTAAYTVSILDDDTPPTIGFVSTGKTVGEAVGTTNISLSIANPRNTPTTVEVRLVGTSTASVGNDFLFTSPTTITFPANSTSNQLLGIPITDDAITENLETIELELVNPSNGATLGIANYTLSINDNDAPPITITFDTASLTVSEGAGTVTVGVTISNQGPSTTSVDMLVDLQSTATFLDFVGGSVSQTITFPANSNITRTISIPILDDSNDEGLEQLILELKFPNNNAVISPIGSFTLNIVDNDGAPSLSFSTTSLSIPEQSGGRFIEVALSGSSSMIPTALVSPTINSTADDGVDFSIANPTLTFLAGFNTQVFFLTVIDDGDMEGNEIIELDLTSANTPVSQGTMTITIIDDETINVKQVEEAKQINVYPVPANQQLFVELEHRDYWNTNEVQVEILNVAGQQVQASTMPFTTTLAIDLDQLPEGVYFLSLRRSSIELPITKKFVVQH